MSSGGLEAGDAALAEMVGAACFRYPRDKCGKSDIGYGGRDDEIGVEQRKVLGQGRAEEERMTRVTREDQEENWQRSNE